MVACGDDNYGAAKSLDTLAPLLAGKCFPKLEHLGLQNSYQQDAVAAALGESKIVSRLKGLDLSMGALTDSGAKALLRHPDLGKLEWLNLRHHYLSDDIRAKIGALVSQVDLSEGVEYHRDVEGLGDDELLTPTVEVSE